MKDKQVPIELIDEMTKVKADFKVLSKDIIENMLKDMSEDEQLKLLATDGMLVKRPLVIGDDFVLTGFREKEWIEAMHV